MNTCATCNFWRLPGNRCDWRAQDLIFPPHPVTGICATDETANAAVWGHRVRLCTAPGVLFYQRPAADGAAMVDGSEYQACLITGEQFGCTLHQPAADEATQELFPCPT